MLDEDSTAFLFTHVPSIDDLDNGITEVPIEAAVSLLPVDGFAVLQDELEGEPHEDDSRIKAFRDEDNGGTISDDVAGELNSYETLLRGGGYPRNCMRTNDWKLDAELVYIPELTYMVDREGDVRLMSEDGVSNPLRGVETSSILEFVDQEEWEEEVGNLLEEKYAGQPARALDVAERLGMDEKAEEYAGVLYTLLQSGENVDAPDSVWDRLEVRSSYRLKRAEALKENYDFG